MRYFSAVLLFSLVGAFGLGLLIRPTSADSRAPVPKASSPAADEGWKEEVASATKDKSQKDEKAKEALQNLRAAEKAVVPPKIDQPRPTPAQEQEAQKKLEEARQRATEATLAQVDACNASPNNGRNQIVLLHPTSPPQTRPPPALPVRPPQRHPKTHCGDSIQNSGASMNRPSSTISPCGGARVR